MNEQSIHFTSADEGEETARADLYGLLAALFAAVPSTALLEAIAAAPSAGDGVLNLAWRELAVAARAVLDADLAGGAGSERLREEYERLYIGIGKPEVMLYGSYYLSGFLMERPLAALRTDLAALGLERADAVVESEDHIASLCEVMRYLIAADTIGSDTLAQQKQFFGTHMQAWVVDMCEALRAHPQAVFYRAVAPLAQRFFEVEMQAFEMAGMHASASPEGGKHAGAST